MVILDTNVLSALMERRPSAVVDWLDRQAASGVWTTAITMYESRLGIALLPVGRKRTGLADRFEEMVGGPLRGRVLPLDAEAAEAAARLRAARRLRGIEVEVRDTLIAGIVLVRGATLATRNVRDFPDIPVVNTWEG